MPLSDAERQKRYRERIQAEGVKRYQLQLPQSVAEQVHTLTTTQHCTKSELFSRLIEAEYQRQHAASRPSNIKVKP